MAILESKFRCSHCAGPFQRRWKSAAGLFLHLLGIVSQWLCCWWYHQCVLLIQSCDAECSETCERTYMAAVFVGVPPVIVFSSTCAGLAGGAVPALTQLYSSSYHAAAAVSSS